MNHPDIDIRAFRGQLRQLERQVELNLATQTSCCGVTVAQCHVLLEVEASGEAAIGSLAACLELDASTLSRTVDGLVRAGLIERREDPENRRRQLVRLTPAGREKADFINDSCDRFYRDLLRRLPGEQAEAVRVALPLLVQAFRTGHLAAPSTACYGSPVTRKVQ
jgi:DNA-binding MarR family transcriptional regulator